VVIAGTDSSDFPLTPDAYATTGSTVVARLSGDLTTLLASTYVPSSGDGVLALDRDGNLLVTSGGYRCAAANPGTGIGVLLKFSPDLSRTIVTGTIAMTPPGDANGDLIIEASSRDPRPVSFTVTATDLTDGPLTPVCNPPSGSFFPLGATKVTCTATNAAGYSASISFYVRIQDTTPPALSLPGLSFVPATGPDGAVFSFVASATDVVDGAVAVICDPPPGSQFPLDATVVNCTATDAAGNRSTGTFVVVVVDEAPPTVAFVGDIHDGDIFLLGDVPPSPTCVAYDLVAGSVPCSVSGYSDSEGDHTLTAVAFDDAGNRGSVSLTYHVIVRHWTILGFYPPVYMGTSDTPTVNTVRAGASVPLKFQVFDGSTERTCPCDIGEVLVEKTSCAALATNPVHEVKGSTRGGTSGVRYDTETGQFIANWQTPAYGAGLCLAVSVSTTEGSRISTFFRLR
jgi:hypothetical protein